MIGRVDFDREALIQPLLKLRIISRNLIGHDADRSSPIDFFQAIQNWSEISFVAPGISHIVDCEDDDRLNALLSRPLRRGESGKISVNVVRVNGTVEVTQSIPIGIARSHTQQQQQQSTVHHFIPHVIHQLSQVDAKGVLALAHFTIADDHRIKSSSKLNSVLNRPFSPFLLLSFLDPAIHDVGRVDGCGR